MSKSNKIRHIVRLRQMLMQWRRKARAAAAAESVPAGHVAVYVGATGRRFVVRASYLNHPTFRRLLGKAEEEYGFQNSGPLRIPCDEREFEEAVRSVSGSEAAVERSRRLLWRLEEFRRCGGCFVTAEIAAAGETRPLLRGWSS